MEHIRMTATRISPIHVWIALVLCGLFAEGITVTADAQTPIDTSVITVSGDTARFWAQIPDGFDPRNPPAVLIWWHQLGGSEHELRDYTDFEMVANERRWIIASHMGPSDRHWNARKAQEHCRGMLDWLSTNYPFSRDSIYMIGGSMGGAAGQVWHNNNCGSGDYLIAANAGGSPILDCQLRQEQYLATGDTNRSMRLMFGGLPADRDSVAFEYHRYSAIHFADTSQSMHFNSLHLPVWLTWGDTDAERLAYGEPAAIWDSLRRAGGTDTSVIIPSTIANHGLYLMYPIEICDWLSGFAVNRYPDNLSINADESGDYYWTHVVLAVNDTTFGRYGAIKNAESRQLDLTLVKNIAQIEIYFDFPWVEFDSLVCSWRQLDPAIQGLHGVLRSVPEPDSIIVSGPGVIRHEYEEDRLTITTEPYDSVSFVIYFHGEAAQGNHSTLPFDMRLIDAYPNPFNSFLNLTIESHFAQQSHITLYDVLGRKAADHPISIVPGHQRLVLAFPGIGSGVYFVKLNDSSAPPLKIMLLR